LLVLDRKIPIGILDLTSNGSKNFEVKHWNVTSDIPIGRSTDKWQKAWSILLTNPSGCRELY